MTTGKTGTIWDYAGASGFDAEPSSNWRKAAHHTGISFFAPWEDPFGGFPEHSRRLARALNNSGFPVHLRSLDCSQQLESSYFGAEREELEKQYKDLLNNSIGQTLAEIYHVVPTVEFLYRLTVHRFWTPRELEAINSFRIVSTVWERRQLEKPIVDALNKFGQLWVANHHDLTMLGESGVNVDKIRVVPVPYFDNDPLLQLKQTRMPGPIRFYHIGKWEPRKAHHEMIGAFLKAFEPGQCKFYLKTSKTAPKFGDYPQSPEESIHFWMNDQAILHNRWTIPLVNRDIYIIKEKLPQSQIVKLHSTGDVYVSLSRGEGFDMPAFDAKLAGNSLLYTPSGGPQDFAAPSDVRVEWKETETCHPFYKWKNSVYLKPDVEASMQGFYSAWQNAAALGGPSKNRYDLSSFRAEAVGKVAADAIKDLLGK